MPPALVGHQAQVDGGTHHALTMQRLAATVGCVGSGFSKQVVMPRSLRPAPSLQARRHRGSKRNRRRGGWAPGVCVCPCARARACATVCACVCVFLGVGGLVYCIDIAVLHPARAPLG